MPDNPGSRQDVERLLDTLMNLKGYAEVRGDPESIAQLKQTIDAWIEALAADASPIWMTCETCGGPIGSRPHCQHVAIEELVAS